MQFESGRQIAGHYQVVAAIGQGAMGVVYKARDTRLDRFVALKVLTAAGQSQDARQRALTEARAIAALNHPNIATIYEIDESLGTPILVLEYLPGGTLRARTGARVPSPDEIVDFALQIASGLAHAHDHGVTHGDVKTENVMFTGDGRLKLTDFGVARVHDDRTVDVDRAVTGTLMYMAPECLHGQAPDCQTDIFSLGVVMEEMTGPQEMPDAFRQLVVRATARDRARRFQSMHDVVARLRPLASVSARAPGAGGPPTILVVEDDATLRDVLEVSLSDEGYCVTKAASGREAIDVVQRDAPHLVLLDVTLPGMNGFDVCRELRRSGFTAPIIMVTGRADEVDRVVGLEIGADDYLTKPFGRRELVARIRVHLRRAMGAAPPC